MPVFPIQPKQMLRIQNLTLSLKHPHQRKANIWAIDTHGNTINIPSIRRDQHNSKTINDLYVSRMLLLQSDLSYQFAVLVVPAINTITWVTTYH